MNVLVVGGAGYIGGAVTDLLIQETKHNIRVYDALLYEESYRKPVDFAFGDVRDVERLKPHLAWADTVIWLAALVGDPACSINPEISYEINQKAVEWLANNYDGRIVFMSTCSVYGAQDGVLTEASPLNPLSVYAVTKLEAEKYLAKKNAIIFRLGTIFGVGDVFSRIRLDLVLNVLTVRAFTTGKITIFGGAQYRPMLSVLDAAKAVVMNLEESSPCGIFNLHKENVKISDLALQVQKHFPNLEVEQTERKFEDTRNYAVSSDQAVAAFGFNPSYSLDHGIDQIKHLLEQGRLRDLENPRYSNSAFLTNFRTHLR